MTDTATVSEIGGSLALLSKPAFDGLGDEVRWERIGDTLVIVPATVDADDLERRAYAAAADDLETSA